MILGHQDTAAYGNTASHTPSIYVGTDGKLYAQALYSAATGFSQSVSPYAVNDGQWHHVALTFDGMNQYAYLDGAVFGGQQTIGANPQSDAYWQLGTGSTVSWLNGNAGWYTFNGLIDEATVYSRALTAAEVLSIVNAGTHGKCDTETFYGMSATSGDNQTGVTTRTLPQPFIVQTNGASGTGTVTFTVNANKGAGGTWTPINGFPTPTINGAAATVAVDSQNFATSPQLTLNGTPGTFTVTASDTVNTVVFNVTSVACKTNPSVTTNTDTGAAGELRSAVNTACGGSTISLANVSGTITLGSRIRIEDSLTITGPGTIDGGGTTRLFFIGSNSKAKISLNNLTLQNGLGQGGGSDFGGGAAGMGGAIFQNGGNLTIAGVTFSGNVAQGGQAAGSNFAGGGFGGDAQQYNGAGGGDLFGIGGALGVNGGPGAGGGASGGNGGFGGGGGIGKYLPTPTGNGGFGGGAGATGVGGFGGGAGSSGRGGGAGFGGAIFQYAGTLSLLNDNFGGNTASGGSGSQNGQGKGGAIFIYAAAGATATASNVTFSNNTAAQAGVSSPNVYGSYGYTGTQPFAYANSTTCPITDSADVCGILVNPAIAPAVGTVTVTPSPANQTLTETVTSTFISENGGDFTDLRWAYVLINSALIGADACYVRYYQPTNSLYLLNDAGTAVMGPITVGSGTLSNSQCTVNGAASTVSGLGATLTVTLAVTSKGFVGAQNVYLIAVRQRKPE